MECLHKNHTWTYNLMPNIYLYSHSLNNKNNKESVFTATTQITLFPRKWILRLFEEVAIKQAKALTWLQFLCSVL